MKRKSILTLTLIITLGISALLSGCNQFNFNKTANDANKASEQLKEGAENTGESAKEGADKAGEAVKEGSDTVKNKVEGVGEAVKYTAINVKDDIMKTGRELKDSTDTKKDYFKGIETDYLAKDDLVRVYEYDSADTINADINTISSDGMSINGVKPGFKNKPHYYKKGNTLIVYEGNDPAYTQEFEKTFGKPII